MAPDQELRAAEVPHPRPLDPDGFPPAGPREYLRALTGYERADAATHRAQAEGDPDGRW